MPLYILFTLFGVPCTKNKVTGDVTLFGSIMRSQIVFGAQKLKKNLLSTLKLFLLWRIPETVEDHTSYDGHYTKDILITFER